MDDGQYLDPRLVQLYDALNPPDASNAFYAQLVGPPPRRVLDLGCGTGQLARQLADVGHTVTATDAAEPMVDAGRRRDPAGRVEWVVADARVLALARRYDVAVMTGHVFQAFVSDDDVAAVLAAARRHLIPGGTLAFDTRNPQARAWLRWTPERSQRTLHVEPFGDVTVSYEVIDTAGDLVRFATRHELAGTTVVTESSLRFLAADAVVARVRAAGFADVACYGDWDRGAVSENSPEIIVVAS
jgi:ubiquinone/menaquinone biosynthesis C-methylase UbiE